MSAAAKAALTLSVFVAIAIFAGGLTPQDFGPGPIRRDGPYLHAAAFALFVAPLVSVWPRRWFRVFVAALVFGSAVEGLQTFVNRAPEWADVLANSIGALSGVLAGFALS